MCFIFVCLFPCITVFLLTAIIIYFMLEMLECVIPVKCCITQLNTSGYVSAACLTHGSHDTTLNLSFEGHEPKCVLMSQYSWYSPSGCFGRNIGLFKGCLDSYG